MQYEEFIGSASARTGRPPEIAEPLTHAAREAVTPGEWEDVGSQMGRELDVLMAGAQ